MVSLLVRVAGFVIASFGLGLLVGWLAWGHGRKSVPVALWRTREREHAALAERVVAAERRAVASAQDADTQRRELTRLRELLSTTWAARDDLAERSGWVEREHAALRLHHERALGRIELLQRRLAELSIGRARNTGMPPALLPGGPGAAPASVRAPVPGMRATPPAIPGASGVRGPASDGMRAWEQHGGLAPRRVPEERAIVIELRDEHLRDEHPLPNDG